MQTVVITGVSTGIGHATAKLLTSQGIKVFGSVRNAADADRLQKELGENYIPLIFDVSEKEKVENAARFVREKLNGSTLWGLINNAGIAVPGAMVYLPINKLREQLEVNLFGQLNVIQAFTPLLGMDKELKGPPGKIINMSSAAGKIGFPFAGAYSISKHGIEALSESLRRELMIFGIDVIIVGPGPIKTPIWEKAKQEQIPSELINSVYSQSVMSFKNYILSDVEKNGLPAEEIAELLLKILRSKKPKTRYAPIPKKLFNWTIPNLLPKRVVDWMIAKKFGLLKK